jgi:hypothetical protein
MLKSEMTIPELLEAIGKYNEKAIYYLSIDVLICEKDCPCVVTCNNDNYIKMFGISPDNNMIHVCELDGDNIRSFDMCHVFSKETSVEQILYSALIQLEHGLYILDKNVYKDLFIDGGRKTAANN